MSRPLKQVIDYFPHMVQHGKTLLILRNEFGNDGYAFWFSLLELLCKTDGQSYNYNSASAWKLLLAETHVSEVIANSILKTLAEIDAIDKELFASKVIWVQNLVDNLDQVYDRRTTGKPQKPLNANNNPTIPGINANNNSVNASSNPASIVEDSIVNKTIQEEVAPTSKKSLKEIFYSFKDDGKYSMIDFDNEYRKFCEYWLEGKKKLKNKKLACHNWLDHCISFSNKNNGGNNYGEYRGNPSQKPAGAFSDLE